MILPKVLMMIFGAIIIGFAYLSRSFTGILEACQSINGVIGGPLLAFFTLAIFFPWVDTNAVLISTASGLAVSIWIFVGESQYPAGEEWTRPLSG